LPGYGVLQIVASITVIQSNANMLSANKVGGVRDVIDKIFRIN